MSNYHSATQSSYTPDGRFEDYQTYSIVSNEDLYTLDVNYIEKGISIQMNSLGYIQNDVDPSIYIYYQAYTRDFRLKSFYQTPIQSWLERKPYYNESDKQGSSKNQSKIEGPSLFISFYDPTIHQEIWRGHMSNIQTTKINNSQTAAQIIVQQFALASKELKKYYSKNYAAL